MRWNERIRLKAVPKLFDVIELLSDRAESGLVAGTLGTIVEELPDSFNIVEFSDEEGRTLSVATLPATDLQLHG